MSDKKSQEQEYPTEENLQEQEPAHDEEDEGNRNPEEKEEDTESMTSSLRALHIATKDAGNADMTSNLEPHNGRVVTALFIACSFISFALMLTACCPVPWYKSSPFDRRSWTLWKEASKIPNDTKTKTNWAKTDCRHRYQMFQAMEAYAIVSCVSSLATMLAGIMQFVGSGHIGVTVALGFFTTAMELVTWSLCVNQYHVYNCAGEYAYVSGVARLGAGFALTVASFGIMFFATMGLGYYLYAFFSRPELHAEKYNGNAITAAFLVFASLTITVVASAFTMWEQYFPTYTIKVTLWHVEIENRALSLREYYSYKHYHCKALNKYFQAGQAFAIISSAVLFVNFLFSVGAVYMRGLKWANLILSICSWVFLLIAWAIMVGARYKVFCKDGASISAWITDDKNGYPKEVYGYPSGTSVEQRVNFTGYHITEGLGMLISAWCIMLPTIIHIGIKG